MVQPDSLNVGIKRYIVEPGTAWVRLLSNRSSGNTVIIAQMTQIEIVSGASRRVREGTLTTRTARAVRLLIDLHARRAYVVIGLTPQVVRRAEDLLAAPPRRTYDAVQLASALESNTTSCRRRAVACDLCCGCRTPARSCCRRLDNRGPEYTSLKCLETSPHHCVFMPPAPAPLRPGAARRSCP